MHAIRTTANVSQSVASYYTSEQAFFHTNVQARDMIANAK